MGLLGEQNAFKLHLHECQGRTISVGQLFHVYIYICVCMYTIYSIASTSKSDFTYLIFSRRIHISTDWFDFFSFFPGRQCLSDPSWQEFRIAQSKSLLSSKVNSFKLTCKIIKWDWISTFIHIYYIFLFSCTFESHKFSMLWYNFALQFDWMRLLVEHFPP